MPNNSENTSVVALYDDDNEYNTNSWNKASVISLVHPNTSSQQHFILNNTQIYEMTSIARNYGSFFIGSRVISNGALHCMTRVDPLFFLLHYLTHQQQQQYAQVTSWQPLDQFQVNQYVLNALSHDESQWKHVCNIKQLGDDLVLYKFCETKALEWLIKKQQVIAQVVQEQLVKAKQQDCLATQQLFQSQGGGAFSNSFRLGDEEEESNGQSNVNHNHTTNNTNSIQLSTLERQAAKQTSVDIVCEYLSSEWQTKLKEKLGISIKEESESDATSTTNNKKRARAAWEANPGQNDADDLHQFTMGTTASGGGKTDDANKVKKEPPKSAGIKQLAKVNTKGMKSLSSFFGAKKKKTNKQ